MLSSRCHPPVASAIIPTVRYPNETENRRDAARDIAAPAACNLPIQLEKLVSEIAELAAVEADPSDELESRPPNIPEELAILPLFNVVIYPQTVVPLAVGQRQS